MTESLPPNFLIHLLSIRDHFDKHTEALPAFAEIFAKVCVIAKRRDKFVDLAISVMMITAKSVVLDVLDHASPQLIAIHVALANDLVFILIDN